MITHQSLPKFQMRAADQRRLEHLPWHLPLEEWPAHGVSTLSIRHGESRHPVIFIESEDARYAIKETTPHMAEREIRNLREIEFRGIPALSPAGIVTVPAPPLLLDQQVRGSTLQYTSGDRGYTVTHLAARVMPHALLFRLPFTRRIRHRLLGAVAVLLVELHEHGIYWGDPSLANILIRIDGRRIMAIMADAETAEIFPAAVGEGLREQDLSLFHESLVWQAEDLRQARGLAEDVEVLDDRDYKYFERRYRWLRREHKHIGSHSIAPTLPQVMRMLTTLNKLGFSLLDMGSNAFETVISVSPGWYVRRVNELLGIEIPLHYARRFYNMILGHQAVMIKEMGHEVTVEEAARDWYERYHLRAILLLRQVLTSDQDPLEAYFAVMRHKWELSEDAGYEIPLDEAVMSWAMHQAQTGGIGPADPAVLASYWRERQPVAEALAPPSIEHKKLEPLLSEEEQPLIHLPESKLAEELQQRSESED
ncbi:MAG TPA: DUF4032 domain-containing protein [Ktedonobacteraceae bacterium]|nr:DUF4032 domain-containing protein [Ktedonobacteraceae bacterium]